MVVKSLGYAGRVIALRVEEGEEVFQAIKSALEVQDVKFAVITGIGGLAEARIAYYSPEDREYCVEEVRPPAGRVIELASLQGTAVRGGEGYSVHLHAVLGLGPGDARAGHLVSAVARPYVEAQIVEVVGADAARVYAPRLAAKPGYRSC